MKKLLKFVLLFIISGNMNAQVSPVNFTITFNSGTNNITCNHPLLIFSASSASAYPYSYVWASNTTTLSGSTVSISVPGTYIVTADSAGFPASSQTLVVVSNNLPPASGVSPGSQTISCNMATGATVISNASGNVTHTFLSPYGGSFTSNAPSVTYTPLGVGTYTHILLDHSSGCSSSSTFTLTSSNGFPTFSLASAQNFTLGCSSRSIASVNITNGSTSLPPGGAVSYYVLLPTGASPSPSGPLSNISTYTMNASGTYVVYVRDNTNNCTTQIPFSITANTLAPGVSVIVPTQVLTCNIPQLQLQGTSTSSNVSYNWYFTGTPNTIFGNTISVMNTGIANQTLVSNYTLNVTDNNNLCLSSTVVPVYQNIFPPSALISNGGNATLTCATPTIMLTNTSSSGIPFSTGFPAVLPVVGLMWYGPSPEIPAAATSTYIAYVNGTYTMIVQDQNNGCKSTATMIIYGNCNLTGIQKNSATGFSIHIFPNPGNGIFTVTSGDLQNYTAIEIYNSVGVLVKKQEVTSDQTIVNIEEAATGIYIIQVSKNNGVVYTSKIIKE
jgi:hypothetical protein